MVGYLRSSFSLLLGRDRGRAHGCGGDRGGGRDGDRGGGRDDRVVDEENSEEGHKWVVFPLVPGDDNEGEHILGVIETLLPIPHLQSLPPVRFDCRNRVDGDNNEEEHKSEAIDR